MVVQPALFLVKTSESMRGGNVNSSEDLMRDVVTGSVAGSLTEVESGNILLVSGELDARRELTELHLAGGQILRIPTALLLRDNGQPEQVTLTEANTEQARVLPVVEEQLQVGKRTVVTGTVRLEKQVQEYNEELDVPLAIRTFDLERVVLNQPVETAPPVRQEGETTIYPLVEEQMVLTKQLILKEELRVTRRDTERRDNRTVTLRRETMVVTRTPGSGS